MPLRFDGPATKLGGSLLAQSMRTGSAWLILPNIHTESEKRRALPGDVCDLAPSSNVSTTLPDVVVGRTYLAETKVLVRSLVVSGEVATSRRAI